MYYMFICFSVGKAISMKALSPVGNVAYGLAWAFFMNYLKHALTGLALYIWMCASSCVYATVYY